MIHEISYSNEFSSFNKKDKFDPYRHLGKFLLRDSLHTFKYTNDLHHRVYPPVRIVSDNLKNPIFVKF